MNQKSHLGPLMGLATVLCWSSYNVAAKYGIENGLTPQALTFLRFAVPGLLVLPLMFAWRRRSTTPKIPATRLVPLVLLGGPLFGLIAVSGYIYTPLSHGLLFAPVAVFGCGTLLGILILKQKVASNGIFGALIMFAGLAVLVGFETNTLDASWSTGIALFVIAGCMWAGYTVLLRLWSIPMIEGTLAVSAASSLLVLPILGPIAFSSLANAGVWQIALQTVFQGLVGGVLGVACMIGTVRYLNTQVTFLLPTFTPVVALVIAATMLDRSPTSSEIIGTAIIFAGFCFSHAMKMKLR